jgi:hypothetical protein
MINLKTAKAIGLTDNHIIARADEVRMRRQTDGFNF